MNRSDCNPPSETGTAQTIDLSFSELSLQPKLFDHMGRRPVALDSTQPPSTILNSKPINSQTNAPATGFSFAGSAGISPSDQCQLKPLIAQTIDLSFQPRQFDQIGSQPAALGSTQPLSTILDPRLHHKPANIFPAESSFASCACTSSNQCEPKPSIETKTTPSMLQPSSRLNPEHKQLQPINIQLPESDRSLSWAAIAAINDALAKLDPKASIDEFTNSAEYKAMRQLKDPPKPKITNFEDYLLKLARESAKRHPPLDDHQPLTNDRRRIIYEM